LLVQHAKALGADRSDDLIGNAGALPERVLLHSRVLVHGPLLSGRAHVFSHVSWDGGYRKELERTVVRQFRDVRRATLALLVFGILAAEPASADRGTCAGGVMRLGSGKVAYALVVQRPAIVYRRPGEGVLTRLKAKNENRYPTVLGVRATVLDRQCKRSWYRVQLPMRPNGVTGYVRARGLWLGRVNTRIVVDLSDRRLTLFRKGRRFLSARAAVGSSSTPTPLGRYYVNQRLVPKDRRGPYGPGAIGISAFSNVLTGWTQGGPVAIHGTNTPSSIGHPVTNGCIRLRNQVLKRLFRATPAGTPVLVRR
jgi:lipoprotein-anchoring transpeptidase ErfK/SrfK